MQVAVDRHLNGGATEASPASYFRLHDSSIARVQDLATMVKSERRGERAFASRRHIVLPYLGSFGWHVGSSNILVDTTRVIFADCNEEYRISHPLGGDASLVLLPDDDVFAEIAGVNPSSSVSSNPFRQRFRLLPYKAQLLAHELRLAAWRGAESLAIDEHTVALLESMTRNAAVHDGPSAIAGPKVRSAQEYLHEHFREAISLSMVADAVGLSPIYLTQVFKKTMGASLYRYVIRLRLAEAIARIERCDDLTDLALELGFSSHSHFSAVFRSAFKHSPSAVRKKFRLHPATEVSDDNLSRSLEKDRPKRLDLCVARSNTDVGVSWTPDNCQEKAAGYSTLN